MLFFVKCQSLVVFLGGGQELQAEDAKGTHKNELEMAPVKETEPRLSGTFCNLCAIFSQLTFGKDGPQWLAELRSEEARSPSKASADWSSKSLIFAVDWCCQPVCNTCDGSHLLNLVEVRGVMFFWSPFMELAFTVWALHADLKVIVFAWFLLCCRVSKSRNFCELNVGNMLQPATAFSCKGRWAYSMFLWRHCTEWSRFCTKLTKADNIRRPCPFRQAKKNSVVKVW